MKRIDRERLGLSEQSEGSVALASARREHRAGEGEADLPERKGLGAFARTENSVGLRPPAEPEQALGREGVDVAAEAPIEPRQSRLGGGVEHLVDGLLVPAGIEEGDAEVEHGEESRLGIRRGRRPPRGRAPRRGSGLPRDRRRCRAPVAPSPTPSGSASGVGEQLEHALRSRFGDVVAAEHELGLSQPGEDRRRLGSRVIGQQGRGRLELRRALLDVTGAPQVAAESLVPPRRASRRDSVTEGFPSEVRGPLVADRAACELGGLPETVTAICRRARLAGGVPKLERALEMVQSGRGRHGLGGVRGEQQRHERRRVIACPVEMKGQFAGSIRAGEDVRRLIGQRVGDAAVQPFAFRWKQLVVDDLTDQRVTKPVRIGVAVDDDELRVDRGAQRNFETVRRPRRRPAPGGRARCRARQRR